MAKYHFTLDVEFETDKPVELAKLHKAKGDDDPGQVLDHFFGKLQDLGEETVVSVTVEAKRDVQDQHGERIEAKGRHNGTSEA